MSKGKFNLNNLIQITENKEFMEKMLEPALSEREDPSPDGPFLRAKSKPKLNRVSLDQARLGLNTIRDLFEIRRIQYIPFIKNPSSEVEAICQYVWELIRLFEKPTGGDLGDYILEWIEITEGAFLMLPQVGDIIWQWKINLRDEKNRRRLKALSKILSPGNKAKGIGAIKRAWPGEKNIECFARMFIKIRVEGGDNNLNAARIVAREMGLPKNKSYLDLIVSKYKLILKFYSSALSEIELEKAVLRSFSSDLT